MRLLRDVLEATGTTLFVTSLFLGPLAMLTLQERPVDALIDLQPERLASFANDAALVIGPNFFGEQDAKDLAKEDEKEDEPVAEPAPAPKSEPASKAEKTVEPSSADPAGLAAAAGAVEREDGVRPGLPRAVARARQAMEGKKPTAGRPPRATSSKKNRCAEPIDEIQQVDDLEWAVERDWVLSYANDLNAAAKLAYVAWSRDEKGKIQGFVVKRIRCGTPLEQAGLKNGDVIQQVNGKNVRSLVQAWGAWRKVKRKEVVRLTVEREGRRIELRYRIS